MLQPDDLAKLDRLAETALACWDLPRVSHTHRINVSENTTYLVEGLDGYKAVLRLHRAGYHSRVAIISELAWIAALSSEAGIPTPRPISGRDGDPVQEMTLPDGERRYLVLFEFIDGRAPDEAGDLAPGFEELGALAAQCHDHTQTWVPPTPFERLTWDLDAVFGRAATWGDWRAAPGLDGELRPVLEMVEAKVRSRLGAYGAAPTRFNLIHADMRLANLIIGAGGTRLIDFDDCGFGWLMYDFAAAISFMEDDPRVPALKSAWLRGYRKVRNLPTEDEAEIDTFIMLRRMALLAWIGSHGHAPEAKALASEFASRTAALGQSWLASAV
ncbi:MAG: phosphotransferase [Pseudomonadota bacterium]